MSKRIISFGAIAILSICALLGWRMKSHKALEVPFYNTADCTPQWFGSGEEAQNNVAHLLPEFSMLDQNGKVIDRSTIKGKIHVADFFFTSCSGICPALSHQFKLLQDSLTNDPNVLLLSYSVTPKIDSVGRLHEYAKMIGANEEKWHLLTGEKSAIYELARSGYFAEEAAGVSKDSSQFLHTEHFVLVDRSMRVRGLYNGTLALENSRLLEDIRSIESEE